MKNLVLSRTDRIGDVVLTTSAFAPLRHRFPDARIRILVRPELTDLLARNPEKIEPVACSPEPGAKGVHPGRIKQWLSTFRTDTPDTIVFLHPDNDLQIAAALAGIENRVGYRKQIGRLALNRSFPYRRHLGLKHEAACNFDLLELIGCPAPPSPRPSVSLGAPVTLPDELDRGGPFVAFHPDAYGDKPRWPASHFVGLAERLVREFGVTIVLIGSEPQPEILRLLEESELPPNSWLDRRGKDDLLTTAGILGKASLAVSRDSGPAHLAAALGTPLVCLMGQCDPIHSPRRWQPLGERVRTLVSDLPPLKKESRERRWHRCFEAIHPDQAFAAARELL